MVWVEGRLYQTNLLSLKHHVRLQPHQLPPTNAAQRLSDTSEGMFMVQSKHIEYEIEQIGNIYVVWVRDIGHRVWSELGKDFNTYEEAATYADMNQYKERT
jgi:hypothetical protein